MKILYKVKGYAFSNILFGSMKDYKQKFTYMYLYQYMLNIDISKVLPLYVMKVNNPKQIIILNKDFKILPGTATFKCEHKHSLTLHTFIL